jgi:hypothetical protein
MMWDLEPMYFVNQYDASPVRCVTMTCPLVSRYARMVSTIPDEVGNLVFRDALSRRQRVRRRRAMIAILKKAAGLP